MPYHDKTFREHKKKSETGFNFNFKKKSQYDFHLFDKNPLNSVFKYFNRFPMDFIVLQFWNRQFYGNQTILGDFIAILATKMFGSNAVTKITLILCNNRN